MKSVVFKGAGQPLAIEKIEAPQPAANEIQIKVHACGICGSDLHIAKNPHMPAGVVFGHEFAGEVSAIGEEVTQWQIGDRVVPIAVTTCGVCEHCLSGWGAFKCENSNGGIGFNPALNGAYSEYVVVGAHDAVRLPDNVSYQAGATVEPLAVAYDAVRRARLSEAESVLIIGAGPIGLCIALWARHFGAANIVVSEQVESRLEVATAMGATATINASKDDVATTFKELTGTEPSVIFEAVGAPGLIQQCVEMAPADGKIVVVGILDKPDPFIPANCVHKRLEMIFTFGYSMHDFRNIVGLLSQERIDVMPMIRHQITLDEVPDTFAAMAKPGEHVKVIIQPSA